MCVVTKFSLNICVKTLGRVTPQETDEFLGEATRMKMFDHPNVLSLLENFHLRRQAMCFTSLYE